MARFIRLRKLYYKVFPTYAYLERVCVSYAEADKLLRESETETREESKWVLDTQYEDFNNQIDRVYLCRRKRITE